MKYPVRFILSMSLISAACAALLFIPSASGLMLFTILLAPLAFTRPHPNLHRALKAKDFAGMFLVICVFVIFILLGNHFLSGEYEMLSRFMHSAPFVISVWAIGIFQTYRMFSSKNTAEQDAAANP